MWVDVGVAGLNCKLPSSLNLKCWEDCLTQVKISPRPHTFEYSEYFLHLPHTLDLKQTHDSAALCKTPLDGWRRSLKGHEGCAEAVVEGSGWIRE